MSQLPIGWGWQLTLLNKKLILKKMKKALSLLAIVALSMGTVNAYAQDEMAATEEVVDSADT